MTADPARTEPRVVAASFQNHILPRVSRTFALTIPQLPEGLREVVGNAYLLCRIADTIEDDPDMDVESKLAFERRFAKIVLDARPGEPEIEAFVADLYPRLSPQMSADEHELIRNTAQVIAMTASFDAPRRAALARCLEVMCEGMLRFQQNACRAGLADQAALDQYCYFVAGVVGELLTELFCLHDPRLMPLRANLMRLAVSFGQGLQMTNILKDVWDDLSRDVCWLPRATFVRQGFDLGQLRAGCADPAFHAGYRELIGIAHQHLRNALIYTQHLPADQGGMRRFCAWAIGMALLTLEKIHRHPAFASGQEVKISRRAVAQTIALTRYGIGVDLWLETLFSAAALRLPTHLLQPGWDGFVAPYPQLTQCTLTSAGN